MNFIKCDSTNYSQGRTKPIKYIVIHYTANDGDTARGNCTYFQGKNRKASAHYFVDEKEVCQSIKEGDTAWHCGAKVYKHSDCRNANSIGVELCSRYNGDLKSDKANNAIDFDKYYFRADTVTNAINLTIELMKKYGIQLDRVIRHFDVTGKKCPAPFVVDEKLWRIFKSRLIGGVEMTISDAEKIINEKVDLSSPKEAIEHIKSYKYGEALLIKIAEALKK